MRSPEIDYYSRKLAALQISAVRATSEDLLSSIYEEMVEAYKGIFAILSHDALNARELAADLAAALPTSALNGGRL